MNYIIIPLMCLAWFIIGALSATIFWCNKLSKYSKLLETANASTMTALDVAATYRQLNEKNLSNLNDCIEMVKDRNEKLQMLGQYLPHPNFH